MSAVAHDKLMLAAADIMGDRHQPGPFPGAERAEEGSTLAEQRLQAIRLAVAHQLHLDHGVEDNARALSEELREVYGTRRTDGTVVQAGMQRGPGSGTGMPRYNANPYFAYAASAPSTSGQPGAPQYPALPTSPTLIAKVGFELEIPRVTTPLNSRGEVLIEGAGWRLETDLVLNKDYSSLEFVLAPMSSMRDIAMAFKEIIELVALMRARVLDTSMRMFRLSEIGDGFSRDAILRKDTSVTVGDIRFGAVMQATYGIRLTDIAGVIDELFDERQAAEIHQAARTVRTFYEAKYSTLLSDNVGGFVELIAMYLGRAKFRTTLGGTVHVMFRMMSRSDFASIFEKLLNASEKREAIRLFLSDSQYDVPDLMAALGLEQSAMVFPHGYMSNLQTQTKSTGPSVIEWLYSIIHGRNQGALKKDLLSPPPGYPLHSGNLDRDYGMGAMGVDEINKTILFEIRGAPYRPDGMPLNGRALHAAAMEYRLAARHNRSLALDISVPARDHEINIIGQLNRVMRNLSGLQNGVERSGDQLNERKWQAVYNITIAPTLRNIGDLQKERPPGILKTAFLALGDVKNILQELSVIPVPLRDAQRVLSLMPAYVNAVEIFEKALWDAESGLAFDGTPGGWRGDDPVELGWPVGRSIPVDLAERGSAMDQTRRGTGESADAVSLWEAPQPSRSAGADGPMTLRRLFPGRSGEREGSWFSYQVLPSGAIVLPDGLRVPARGWVRHGPDFLHTTAGVVLRGDTGWIGTIENAEQVLAHLNEQTRTSYVAHADTTAFSLSPSVGTGPTVRLTWDEAEGPWYEGAEGSATPAGLDSDKPAGGAGTPLEPAGVTPSRNDVPSSYLVDDNGIVWRFSSESDGAFCVEVAVLNDPAAPGAPLTP